MSDSKINFFVENSEGVMDIAGLLVPSINAPIILVEEVSAVMFERHPEAPFIAMYWDTPEGMSFVLKTDKKHINVGKIAQVNFNGTGHKTMATFKSPPKREMAGEFIPLELELPPDELDVIGLFRATSGLLFAAQVYHEKDESFDLEDVDIYGSLGELVAWSYMPELPGILENDGG